MCPNHRHYIEYHCRCVQYIRVYVYDNTKNVLCVRRCGQIEVHQPNDIIQFNDFMMHIKREIDSLFLLRVLHFILLPTFKVYIYFAIDQFSTYRHPILAYTARYIKTAIATVQMIDKLQYSIIFQN